MSQSSAQRRVPLFLHSISSPVAMVESTVKLFVARVRYPVPVVIVCMVVALAYAKENRFTAVDCRMHIVESVVGWLIWVPAPSIRMIDALLISARLKLYSTVRRSVPDVRKLATVPVALVVFSRTVSPSTVSAYPLVVALIRAAEPPSWMNSSLRLAPGIVS